MLGSALNKLFIYLLMNKFAVNRPTSVLSCNLTRYFLKCFFLRRVVYRECDVSSLARFDSFRCIGSSRFRFWFGSYGYLDKLVALTVLSACFDNFKRFWRFGPF